MVVALTSFPPLQVGLFHRSNATFRMVSRDSLTFRVAGGGKVVWALLPEEDG
ncbi:hypothetical protein [Actinomadura sp. WAC 06369]|uniref:hypothetical protein n=1 Tax=Actinomadura sp. WAC 06369 TaxID=2203193 RepID=UPI0018F3627C|nr:hypothetical protein [Actinomadura sp. WAC 06369]